METTNDPALNEVTPTGQERVAAGAPIGMRVAIGRMVSKKESLPNVIDYYQNAGEFLDVDLPCKS